MKRDALITGRGALSPVGRGVEALWRATVDGRSGVVHEARDDFSGLSASPVSAPFAAVDVAAIEERWSHVPASSSERLMLEVIGEALDEARWQPTSGRVALVAYSSGAQGPTTPDGFLEWVAALRELGPADRAAELCHFAARGPHPGAPGPSALHRHLCQRIGADLELLNVEATCATGLRLLIEARRLIELGRADAVIVAAEVRRITQTFFGSYSQMMALSRWRGAPEAASRPFDRGHSGMVLADGAAALVLESAEHARARSAPGFGHVRGWGLCTGLEHPTAPSVAPMVQVMRRALEHSGFAPADIDSVNTHGTSTRLNDRCEARAIREVFGELTDRLGVTACKSILGHGSIAAALLEVVIASACMERGVLPPLPNCDDPDPACELPIPRAALERPLRAVLKNAFGFGGHYASMVLSRD